MNHHDHLLLRLLAAIQTGQTAEQRAKGFRRLWQTVQRLSHRLVPALIGLLGDPRGWVRSVAADALGLIGRPALAAVPALTAALEDEEERVRLVAAVALRRIDPDTNVVVPAWAEEAAPVPLSEAIYQERRTAIREALERLIARGEVEKVGDGPTARYRIPPAKWN
jgi:hypothetical protein